MTNSYILPFPNRMVDAQGRDHSIWQYYHQTNHNIKPLNIRTNYSTKAESEKLFFEGSITKSLDRRHNLMKIADIIKVPMISLNTIATDTLDTGEVIHFHYMNGEAVLGLATGWESEGFFSRRAKVIMLGRLLAEENMQPVPEQHIDYFIASNPQLAHKVSEAIRRKSEERIAELVASTKEVKNDSTPPVQPQESTPATTLQAVSSTVSPPKIVPST